MFVVWFSFASTCQVFDREDRLRYDLSCVTWDVKHSINQPHSGSLQAMFIHPYTLWITVDNVTVYRRLQLPDNNTKAMVRGYACYWLGTNTLLIHDNAVHNDSLLNNDILWFTSSHNF